MPILGIIASQQPGKIATLAYDSIATVTVGAGGQNTISFTSIPQTYKHLQIRGIAKNNQSAAGYGSSTITASFNSDTTYTNYYGHQLNGNGSSVNAYTNQASGYYGEIGMAAWGNSTQTNMFSAFVADILDYTNTSKYKTIKYLAGKDANGGGDVNLGSGLWMSTSAITSITLYNYLTSLNFSQYSSFALYGIKG